MDKLEGEKMPKRTKFKAWDKKDKTMKEVVAINFFLEQVVLKDITRPFEDVVLLEYTGITDIKNKEIYENDFIRNNRSGKIYRVIWNGSHSAFEAHDMENQYNSMFFANRSFGNYEVIGNVYEDPELLRG